MVCQMITGYQQQRCSRFPARLRVEYIVEYSVEYIVKYSVEYSVERGLVLRT